MNEAAALPSPRVLLSRRLKRYYGRLRRPPDRSPTSRGSPGYRTPHSDRHTAAPVGPGRASPVPAATIRTFHALYAGKSFGAAIQALDPFRGLRRDGLGSALPIPRPKAGTLTARQASLDAADRSVAPP